MYIFKNKNELQVETLRTFVGYSKYKNIYGA